MRIERIVMTGDVFRTTDGDAAQLYNVRWLRGELARLLYELTGLWPDIGYRRNAPDNGRAVIAEWYRLMGHVPSLKAWAATYGEIAPPGTLIEAMRADYERALVIGFELSPLMRSVLDSIGAPWVDLEVSPIRFLDDLALNIGFSWAVNLAHPGLLSPDHVQGAVARLRARHGEDASAAHLDGCCVFLAQTRYDRTLIKGGAFFPDSEAIVRIAEAMDRRTLVLKPHPLAPDNPILPALRQRFGARTTGANIYAILAAAADTRFLTVSSSAAIEARLFGHSVEIFHPAANAGLAPATSLWAHRSAAFWRAALAPLVHLRPGVDFEEGVIPDRLRRSLGAWGWQPRESADPAQAPAADAAVRRVA
jgi:hypothetical protein